MLRCMLCMILCLVSVPALALEQSCIILYDLDNNHVAFQQGSGFCDTRLPVDSTFKVALSLMAFDQQLITEDTLFHWDGVHRSLPAWNHNQTPASWLRYSVVWVSQRLTPQLGLSKINHYLSLFEYGDQDFSGDAGKNNGLTHAWLSSSLTISAKEQVSFLRRLIEGQLPVSHVAMVTTRKNMYLKTLDDGYELFGKTGSGVIPPGGVIGNGWFVGYLMNDLHRYVIVSDCSDSQAVDSVNKNGVKAERKAIHAFDAWIT